jgi:hypothetical protein
VATTTAIAAIIGSVTAVAGTAYQISQGKPKQPTPTQASKDPNVDAFRRQNSSSMAPGAALAGNSSTGGTSLMGGGGTGNVGTSTLLGQ